MRGFGRAVVMRFPGHYFSDIPIVVWYGVSKVRRNNIKREGSEYGN
jgi:hypothetical protein